MSDYIMVSSPTMESDLVTKTDYVVYIPLATKETYGSVKVGDGLLIDYGIITIDPEILTGKVDIYQGVENAGKVLYVNDEGYVDLRLETQSLQIQYDNKDAFPEIGSDKLIYVDLSDNSLWIYKNEEYVSASSSLKIDADDWFSIDGDTTEKEVSTINFDFDFIVTFPDENKKSTVSLSSFIKNDIAKSYNKVEYDSSTGILTFNRANGEKTIIDLPLELIVDSGYYDEETQSLVLLLANGDIITIPVSALVKDCYSKEEINDLLSEKQNILYAGDSINISEDNVIKVLVDDVISESSINPVQNKTLYQIFNVYNDITSGLQISKQDKLTAGENVTISEDNVISVTGGGGGLNIADLPKFTNKLYIDMSKASSLAGVLTLPIVSSSNFIVDWGDATTTEYVDAVTEISHTYADASFKGWVTIYGDWQGVQFTDGSHNNKDIIIKVIYDYNISVIPGYAFHNCKNMSDIILPNQWLSLNYGCFYGCKFKSIKLPDASTSIASDMFRNSYLYNIDIPDSVTIINSGAFRGNYYITKIVIPDHVNSISSDAFRGFQRLRSIQIGKTPYSALNNIGSYAFDLSNGTIDKVVIYCKTPPSISTSSFNNEKVKVYFVLPASLKAYKTATNWAAYADKIYPIGGNYNETITIPASSWDTTTNTVTVEAVGATSEDRNIITWNVSNGGVQVENTYGLKCTAQGTMSLTFSCETIPTEDVEISVRYMLTNY